MRIFYVNGFSHTLYTPHPLTALVSIARQRMDACIWIGIWGCLGLGLDPGLGLAQGQGRGQGQSLGPHWVLICFVLGVGLSLRPDLCLSFDQVRVWDPGWIPGLDVGPRMLLFGLMLKQNAHKLFCIHGYDVRDFFA